jgi:hypothetical protein
MVRDGPRDNRKWLRPGAVEAEPRPTCDNDGMRRAFATLTSLMWIAACGAGSRPAAPIWIATPPADAGASFDAALVVETPAPPPAPPPIVSKPEPPPVEPLDPNLDAESWWFEGANDTHAWLSALAMNDPQLGYSVVVDLATGCAVESYKSPRVFDRVSALLRPLYGETYLNEASPADGGGLDAKVHATLEAGSAEIRKTIGLASRFGLTSFGHGMLSWNAEGPHVLVRAGLLYHSGDGGRTFRAVDDHPADDVSLTPDGKMAVYTRCQTPEAVPGRAVCHGYREIVSWPVDGSRAPRPLAVSGLSSRSEGLSNDGHVILWSTDARSGCVLFVNPETGATDRKVCVSDPHFAKAKSSPPVAQMVKLSGFSPEEKYAALDWQGFTKYLTYETAIVDMTAGKIVRVLPEWQLRGLDDEGTALVGPWAEGAGDATYRFALGKPKKLLWPGFMMTWEPKRKRAILEIATPRQRRKLGKVACKILRVEKTP